MDPQMTEAKANSSSPSTSPSAPSVKTNGTSPPRVESNPDSDDDFFGLASSSSHTTGVLSAQIQHDVQSDIPQLRRIHVTNGYREGLSTAKETTLQTGFDEGFPIGAAVALRVGRIAGVLQALVRSGGDENGERVSKVLKASQKELQLKALVEVTNIEGERNSGDDDDRLVMEDVRVKEELIESWEKVVQKLLEDVVVE